MRLRLFYTVAVFTSLLQLSYYVHRQVKLADLGKTAAVELRSLEQREIELRSALRNASQRSELFGVTLQRQYADLKNLLESTRRNYVRIKGVPEKPNEILEEKIVELADFIDVHITTAEIERANRIGVKRRNGARAIVAQLSSYKIKQKLIREASAPFRNLEFTIQDDVTNYVMPLALKPGAETEKECRGVAAVSKPIVRSQSDTMFGAWMRDPLSSAELQEGTIWVMSHFYENREVEEFANLRDVTRGRPRVVYTLPYEWAGTGHVIYNGSLYFNKFNSSTMVRFQFSTKKVVVERHLPDAGFGNTAPYQWSGSTDIDFAVDEMGLWVIYATPDNALDIVISKLDPENLEVLDTWNTNWRKQWSGNAFMACGILYVLKKYDEEDTSIGYTYNTRTKTYKHVDIKFRNAYEWNTMLAYNHKEEVLYAWDRGFLVNYNVTMETDKHG